MFFFFNFKARTEAPVDKEKRSIKKYGGKLDTTGSPSRSRSATKELIRKYPPFVYFDFDILEATNQNRYIL